MEEEISFRKTLLDWAEKNKRPLPWKESSNPYHIWLSEIILQQTRVEQGLPYYLKFIKKYPTVTDLANAPEDELFKLWEGLGYYSRARNLHTSAKMIATEYQGVFPTQYKDIRTLKGVGDYTAAAIASFAYNQPYAVVDGNVYRFLARFFGIETPIDIPEGKKKFQELADKLLDQDQPARYNQAMMDFGATWCTYPIPHCLTCPFMNKCLAFKENKTKLLPVKSKKNVKKNRFFYYLIINVGEHIVLHKRADNDVWAGLHDFPLIELDTPAKEGLFLMAELEQTEIWKNWIDNQPFKVLSISKKHSQTLTHQKIEAFFIELALTDKFFVEKEGYFVVERKKIKKFAFPKIIGDYLGTQKL